MDIITANKFMSRIYSNRNKNLRLGQQIVNTAWTDGYKDIGYDSDIFYSEDDSIAVEMFYNKYVED